MNTVPIHHPRQEGAMTNLDTNPTTFRVPTPNPIQLVSGPTTWFHVPRPRCTHMAAMPHASLSGTAVESLLRWVLHQSALYTLELRLCGSGQHGGIWLGLTGRGATPRCEGRVWRTMGGMCGIS